MSSPEVRELLTSGQAAVVLHRSATTISRWARSGKLPALGRIEAGNGGLYVFDPEVVKQKALDLALPDRGPQLELGLDRKAS